MRIGRLLGEGKVAEVFEVGHDVLKLYRAGIGPEPARREADNLAVVEALPVPAPRALGVVEVNERWGLLMTRAAGRPLAERLADPGDLDSVVGQVVELQRQLHRQPGFGLVPLKERLAGQIARAAALLPDERQRLMDRLMDLPVGDRLCHGDFHPFNVMADGERLTIVDWLDATCGPPAADAARSYLLARHNMPALGERYLEAYLDGPDMSRAAVMAWLPVLAGARLSENVPAEEAVLLDLVRGG